MLVDPQIYHQPPPVEAAASKKRVSRSPEVPDKEPAKQPIFPGEEAPIIRWWYQPGRDRWALLWLILTVATLVLFFISSPDTGSPLISAYLDLLDVDARWAIARINAQADGSYWLSMLFIFVFCTWLILTFVAAVGSGPGPAPEQDQRKTRYFGTGHLARRTQTLRIGIILLITMLISNLALFPYYGYLLEDPTLELDSVLFRIVYFLAIISRLLGLFFVLGTVVQLFLEDFWRPIKGFYRDYGSYFYPALIAIAIVAFVFRQMDQFDDLFIELMGSTANFMLFSLFLFPASIIIIWFTPSYLMFTDRQFANRRDSWDILFRIANSKQWPGLYAWTILHKRLFWQLDTLANEDPPAIYLPKQKDRMARPTAAFGRFRTILALVYILTLVGICADIYFDNQPNPPGISGALIYLLAGAGLLYVILALRQVNLAAQGENNSVDRHYETYDRKHGWLAKLEERVREKRGRDGKKVPKAVKTVTKVGHPYYFYFGLGMTALALLLFLFALVFVILGEDWQISFRFFLGFISFSVLAFLWLALYQPFFQEYTFTGSLAPSDKWMDRLDHLTTQAMLLSNPTLVVLSLLFFLAGLFFEGFVHSDFVASLNPLNIYLLLINGLIAGIILLDRLILLRDRKKHFWRATGEGGKRPEWGGVSTANFIWGCAIIAVALAMAYLGNSYHEIPYQADDELTADPLSLDQYVDNFVNMPGDSSRPVIFVAADGGGLKACYWTMLNLYQLDSMGLYDNHVFALSGASGGTIGLSMYNYLKAQKLDRYNIRRIIDELGDRNFLSGDFTGLLTRFPLNYWPNLPGLEPSRWQDRMESMSQAYFDIVGGQSERYGYAAIRERPFWYPWSFNPRLPLMIVNTARAEDGMLGTVTPLKENPLVGTIDLTYSANGSVISYPDATFLSNRFPIASPAARIPGKGHFLDAGSADNSGINSIYGLLREMKRREVADTSGRYQRFFERKVIILSLRNAQSRYVRDVFLNDLDSLNRYPYQSEFSANTNVAVNTGLTGIPISWDDYLRSEVPKDLGLIDEYLTVDLPFRLRKGDVFSALGGELRDVRLPERRDSLNAIINNHLADPRFSVMPPLGRVLAEPVREYMKEMMGHPEVRAVYDRIE